MIKTTLFLKSMHEKLLEFGHMHENKFILPLSSLFRQKWRRRLTLPKQHHFGKVQFNPLIYDFSQLHL